LRNCWPFGPNSNQERRGCAPSKKIMTDRKDASRTGAANAVLEETSFLYGSNALYIEEMFERYQENPRSVDASWQEFFEVLRDEDAVPARPSWQRDDWPPRANGEATAG